MMSSVTDFVKQLCTRLTNEGVVFCILRDHIQLESEIDHDLDLFVSPGDIKKFNFILNDFCHANKSDCIENISNQDYKAFLIKNNLDEIHFFKIDVWTGFFWRGLKWFDNKVVEKNIQFVGQIPVANNQLALAIRILKDIIFTSELPDRSLSRVQSEYSVICNNGELDKFKSLFATRSANSILTFLENNNYLCVKKQARVIRWSQIKSNFKFFNDFFYCLKRIFIFIVERIISYFKPSGMLIVLLGPDGSGKSTLAKALESGDGRNLFNGCIVKYSRPNLLPQLSRVAKLIRGSKKVRADGYDLNSNDKVTAFKGSLQIIYYTIDFILGRIVLLHHLSRGRLVIYDRYFYDYFIQTYWDHVPTKLKYICTKFVFRPEILFYLHAESEFIFNRKPELKVNVIADQQDRIERLDVSPRPVKINSAQAIELSVISLLSEIFNSRKQRSVIK